MLFVPLSSLQSCLKTHSKHHHGMRLFLTLPSGSHISQLVLLSPSLYFMFLWWHLLCCSVTACLDTLLPNTTCISFRKGSDFNFASFLFLTVCINWNEAKHSPQILKQWSFVRDDAFFLMLGFMHCFSSRRPFHVKMPKAKVQDYPELGPRLNFQCLKTHTQHTARPQSEWVLWVYFPWCPWRNQWI